MSLTVPIEDMSRMQVTLKLSLPDGRLSFDLKPNSDVSSISSICLSGLVLHFKGTHDDSGLSLCVWASETSRPLPVCSPGPGDHDHTRLDDTEDGTFNVPSSFPSDIPEPYHTEAPITDPASSESNRLVGGCSEDTSQRLWDSMPDWDSSFAPSAEHTMSNFHSTTVNYGPTEPQPSDTLESLGIFAFDDMTWPDFTPGMYYIFSSPLIDPDRALDA